MNPNSKTIVCQQCGGTASPVPGHNHMQCDYCLARVFSSEHPLTVDRITPMAGDLQADCPVCFVNLCTGKLDEHPALYCDQCYGLLLKIEHFGAIVRERRARRKGCEAEAVQKLNTEEYERKLSCPACDRKMDVHPYYGPGNIVIDTCQSCHYVWLDHAELRTVERVEGDREPELLPLHVNAAGDVTVIPPAERPYDQLYDAKSPLSIIADIVFG